MSNSSIRFVFLLLLFPVVGVITVISWFVPNIWKSVVGPIAVTHLIVWSLSMIVAAAATVILRRDDCTPESVAGR